MRINYESLYLKYKSKYIKLKSKLIELKKIEMTGGNSLISQHIGWIHNIISQIEKKIENKSNGLIELINTLENYISDQDIPINLNFNAYNLSELSISIVELKKLLNSNYLNEIYQQRNKLYQIDENNYNEIIDWFIKKENITSVNDINQLFTSLVLGSNKNYIIFYMVLLRYLISNKLQLSIIDQYSPILSFYGLKSCLSSHINSDEYLPLILKLIVEYIDLFPIKKVLIIKHPSNFEFDLKNKSKLLELEQLELPNNQMIKFDTKNKIFQYESGNIKQMDNINFYDLIQILFNLFRVYIPNKLVNDNSNFK
jgi:hypothetical protein